ncbi:uncharacterized protein LOC116248176 [Nymphaea colorata]|nr:uncharacterized protein LOC116248176 [Nymphaea colorata]
MKILRWWSIAFLIAFLRICGVESVVAPTSGCYVIDSGSFLLDFTDWIGHVFEYLGKDTDLAVRFCKDVEQRSQTGYVDFGQFDTSSYFASSSGTVEKFVQEYHGGDLLHCEDSFDKMGRAAQVNIKCGTCSNTETCTDKYGCICNVSYDSTMCRVFVDLAISCTQNGSRVFEGFTVGFHPRSYEVIYNGMTQLGFDRAHREFSFATEHAHVPLYLTAVSSLSGLVGKPHFKVYPENGLEVELAGSGAVGHPPTTLSPTILDVSWRCEKALDAPYEVFISIPIKGYEPVEFSLTKSCEYKQELESDSTRGWATFGIISCVLVVASMAFCCGGFIYKTRVEHQYGLYALPGMTLLSACLEAVSGPDTGYTRSDNLGNTFINQTVWDRIPVPVDGAQRSGDRRYGSI